MDLTQLKLGDVMIHDVPVGGSDAAPILTDAPVTLDQQLVRYFTNKLRTSLQTRGVDVSASEDRDPTVRNAVAVTLLQPSHLASRSRDIAARLHDAQTGSKPRRLALRAAGGSRDATGHRRHEARERARH
jgi:hypothetical protein